MNMKIKYSVILCSVWCFCACSDYLDVVPDNIPTVDHAFNNRAMAERFLFTCYSYLPNPADYNACPAFMAGRENWTLKSTIDNDYYFSRQFGYPEAYSFNIALGLQNSNNPLLNYWDGGNGGNNLFVALRDCNTFLDNIHKTVDVEPNERNRWIAEVKFLKAYYHFYLLRSYGPIPIVEQNLLVSATIDEVRVYREPVEKVAGYIVSLLDEAAEGLEPFIQNETQELGRATKTMALALKAKTLILMASPMYNGNPYYQDMKDSRGINLFPTTPDPAKWQAAAQAIREAIDCAHDAGCELYYYQGFNPVSDDTKAKLNIRGAVTDRWNREIIWACRAANTLQGVSMVRTNTNQIADQYMVSMMSPTLDVAERFYSNNGVPIEEDKNFDYERRYETGFVQAQDRYFMREGYETANLHLNREVRFYASLYFDGCMIYGNGSITDDPATMRYAQMKKGQAGGMLSVDRYSITGYLPQKLVHINSVASDIPSWSAYSYPFPYIRLADLYLMYAEALNEIKPAPDDEVFYWIDEVRRRASLQGVRESWTNHSTRPDKFATQSGMREIIHRERLIEMTCEGENYWDLLRWTEAERVMSMPIRGWNMNGTNVDEYYNVRVIATPEFGVKDYLTPIRQASLDINTNLVQNYGW